MPKTVKLFLATAVLSVAFTSCKKSSKEEPIIPKDVDINWNMGNVYNVLSEQKVVDPQPPASMQIWIITTKHRTPWNRMLRDWRRI